MTITSRPGSRLGTGYDPLPHYPVTGGAVARGWAAAVASLPTGVRALGVDGPAELDWEELTAALRAELPVATVVGMAELARPWPEVVTRTGSAELEGDPDFARLADRPLDELFDIDAARRRLAGGGDGLALVVGPGAALCGPDVLWWADLPKRYAESRVASGTGRNLAAPDGARPTTRRLFYVDWPMLDRHRDAWAGRIDRWLDTQDIAAPTSISGSALRASCAALAGRPFRTRPTFNTTPWGGHWAQRELRVNRESQNTALGYELIAPESGVLLGDSGGLVEIPFQLVVALAPEAVLGPRVQQAFGSSFPVRFDYLDTMDGGNLSVHCHPQSDYMRRVFGWPYTQHETYYLMATSPGSRVFLGLREGIDVEDFHALAHRADADGIGFDIEEFVQTFPAQAHQLYLVPAGTPHASSAGNVVLEVSATPYLYSLRFYDWLRRDGRDQQRPVHVEHAFCNLDPRRAGAAVARDLIQTPHPVAAGPGWTRQRIGALAAMFFEVHRLAIEPDAVATLDPAGTFHVMTVVGGSDGTVETDASTHPLHYAETIAIPAAAGPYSIRNTGAGELRLVTAFVP